MTPPTLDQIKWPTVSARVFVDERRILRALVISRGPGSWVISVITQNRTSVQHTASSARAAREWLVAKFGGGRFVYSGEVMRDEPSELFCDRCARPLEGAPDGR